MPNPVVVNQPLSTVQLAGEIQAVVLAVLVRSGYSVQYEVAWWANAERKTAWVEACEVTPLRGPELTVGFGFVGPGVAP